jgi:hypothetical protein
MGKSSLILALVAAICASSALGKALTDDSKFFWYPKDDGTGIVPAFLEGAPATFADPDNIHFYLFTLNNRLEYDVIANTSASLDASHWDKNAIVKIFSHGFSSSWDGGSAGAIRAEYVEKGYPESVNLVIVNWKSLAAAPWYEVAARGTELVGEKIAYLVHFLVQNQYTTLDKIHVFGHSLGAHASAWGGQIYRSLSSGSKFPRITGLDPALPLFGAAGDDARLDKTDADFVDVVHTSGGSGLAFVQPRGHIDFYPNKGKMYQPGCGVDLAGACSHSLCYDFYTESVRGDNFKACRCNDDDWEDFTTCNCDKGTQYMGEWTPTTASGIYHLQTNAKPPYAQG